MTETACVLAGMDTVFVLAVLVLLFVPVQALICQPELGIAPLRLIDCPEVYCLVEQPVELVGEAVGFVPLPLWLKVNV